MSTINKLLQVFKPLQNFSLKDAYAAVPDVPTDSVRARIYENLGITFDKVARGIYCVKQNDESCVLLEGDGKDLSFLEDDSIDCIVTDHPWEDKKANVGGGRNFVSSYDCFRYTQQDFDEKARVLKDGSFLVEFFPTESDTNIDYRYEVIQMARKAGFEFYTKVPWKKGSFIANTGRKSKNTEDVLIFTKGKARSLRPDVKKDLKDPTIKHYMSGSKAMLPTEFDFDPPSKKNRIHQAEKPVGLIESILDFFTFENEIILDQFAGSGVVGEACINKNRKCILIEKSKQHITTIQNRLNLVPVPVVSIKG